MKAKKEKKSKLTARENIRLIVRGLKLFASFPKPLLLSKAVSSFFNASVPFINIYFSAQILSELAGQRDRNTLIALVLVTIVANAVFALIRSSLSRWNNYCDSQTHGLIQKVYTDKFLSMDYVDAENPEVQNEFYQIRQHMYGMGYGLSRLIRNYSNIIQGIIQIIISFSMAFPLFSLKVPEGSPYAYLDSPFAVVAVAAVLLVSVLLAPYFSVIGGKVWVKGSVVNNKSNRLANFYYYTLTDMDRAKDNRIYNQKKLTDKESRERVVNVAQLMHSFEIYNARFNALGAAVTHLSNGLIYIFVALKAFAGAFGLGGIVRYVGAITQFGNGFATIVSSFGDILNNNVYLEKTFKFLDIPNKKRQGTISVGKRQFTDYVIEFRNVSFKYPDSDSYALKNLSMKFNAGKRMAVVGMNGSGKTTMIKLLCRLHDPTEGEITLNGIDIKKYDYNEYMAIFSVVFQDFKLLPFALGENVAVCVDYDKENAEQALEKSGFGSRLAGMPKRLETNLYKDFGEDGVEVSGGEAQKIALARALYKDVPLIVLDEPTAALDPIAEFEIYSKFNDIVGNKTAIFISHRLSSCRFCDDIAVFHEGMLIQRGGHESLLSDENGKYYELWNAQAQYYTKNNEAS